MNCKPGDRAQVVRNVLRDPCREKMFGWVVVVTQVLPVVLTGNGRSVFCDAWQYQGPPRACPLYNRACAAMQVIPDADLLPLPPVTEVRQHDIANDKPIDQLARELEGMTFDDLLPPEGFLPDLT